MATYSTRIISGTGQVDINYYVNEGTLDAANNRSIVNWQLDCVISNGYRTGVFDFYADSDGRRWGVGSSSFTSFSGTRTICSGSYWKTHDANGAASVYNYGWCDAYYGSGGNGGTLTLTRLALAPTIYAITVDTITSTSARIGCEISSVGHGTSANMTAYYRKYGDTTWIAQANQADVGGYNYWNVTGLAPGTEYEYTCNVWNNMGDVAYGTYYRFTTLSSGMLNIMLEIMQ